MQNLLEQLSWCLPQCNSPPWPAAFISATLYGTQVSKHSHTGHKMVALQIRHSLIYRFKVVGFAYLLCIVLKGVEVPTLLARNSSRQRKQVYKIIKYFLKIMDFMYTALILNCNTSYMTSQFFVHSCSRSHRAGKQPSLGRSVDHWGPESCGLEAGELKCPCMEGRHHLPGTHTWPLSDSATFTASRWEERRHSRRSAGVHGLCTSRYRRMGKSFQKS